MPNNDNKNPKPQHKTLSNSLRLKTPHNVKSRQSVSNILNRLPFLRQLNESQNQLLNITPVWQKWCANQANSVITDLASPANIDAELLSISCTKSSAATLLKHQTSNLLETLHKAGFDQIKSIRVQMTLNQPAPHAEDDDMLMSLGDPTPKQLVAQPIGAHSHTTPSSEAAWHKPSASSVKSIEAAHSLIKNEQLAASLKRLAETLKKAT
jgi:hypothetical protein